MDKFELGEYQRRASALLHEAAALVDKGELEESVWRIVDAAGALATGLEAWQQGQLVGVTLPTGRGFRVVQSESSDAKVRDII